MLFDSCPVTHTLLARAWETLLVMTGGGIKDDHTCVSTHTYKRTHTADLYGAEKVQGTDSWMTLCGPLAVCKGRKVSGQTTVAMHEANKRADSQPPQFRTTLAMVNESFTND